MQVHGFGGGGDTAMVVDIGEQGVEQVGAGGFTLA